MPEVHRPNDQINHQMRGPDSEAVLGDTRTWRDEGGPFTNSSQLRIAGVLEQGDQQVLQRNDPSVQ